MKAQVVNVFKAGVFSLAAVTLLVACTDDDDDGPGTGTLSLAVTDAPVHNATEVWVQFSGVSVKPRDGEPVDIEFDEVQDIDLMELSGANSATLLNGEELTAGPYNWVRLNVNADLDGTFDSFVMTDTGEMVELEVTSQRGLQLSSGFTITQNQETSFIIDWDLNQGLTNPVGQDGWKLRPSLRITDETEFGGITGTVAEALVMADSCTNDLAEDIGNSVYIYEGADVTPDDIDQGDVDPLATGDVTQDQNGAYTYSVTFLSPADYTVAFTCQALDDDPETDDEIAFAGAQNATVQDDEETVVDF